MLRRIVLSSVFVKLVANFQFLQEEQVGLGRAQVCGFQRREEMVFGASVCDMELVRKEVEE